jgi:hypothetical protein
VNLSLSSGVIKGKAAAFSLSRNALGMRFVVFKTSDLNESSEGELYKTELANFRVGKDGKIREQHLSKFPVNTLRYRKPFSPEKISANCCKEQHFGNLDENIIKLKVISTRLPIVIFLTLNLANTRV